MSNRLKLLVGLVYLILTVGLFGEGTGSIRGVIVTAEGKIPLQSAEVIIKNTEMGTVSNKDGKFELTNLPNGTYLLTTQFIGYNTKETPITIESNNETIVIIELEMKPIHIEELIVTGFHNNLSPQNIQFSNTESPKEIGEYFRQINGGNAIKKGGFALDPVLRSFKYDQLNVQYDGGIKCWGGCPNRMDPPTSHIQSDDIERIEILKGPFNVRFGQTMGGVVNLVMKKPNHFKENYISGSAMIGYESVSKGKRGRLSINGKRNAFDYYLAGGTKEYSNYTTGSNIEVPSSFQLSDYTVKAGYQHENNHRMQVSYRQSFADNIDYPGLPMDAKDDDTDILAFDYSGRSINKTIHLLTLKLYKTNVYHKMDNENRPNRTALHAEVKAFTKTYGGRAEIGLSTFNASRLYFGMDYYSLSKTGDRERAVFKNMCNGMVFEEPMLFTDHVWQDSEIADLGIFSELDFHLNHRMIGKAGFRYDIIQSEIKDPSIQFTDAYGEISDFDSDNYTGMLSFSFLPNATTEWSLLLGRGMRAPSITERYVNHLPIGSDAHEYFGNPYLKSEVNHQIEIAFGKNERSYSLRTSIYYSQFIDYISAKIDTSLNKVYMACIDPKDVKRFQNISNAHQFGFETELSGTLWKNINYHGSVSYTIGDNLDENEPLPEVPPLVGRLTIQYRSDNNPFTYEMSGRFVAEQNRVSSLFGETATPGFNIFDLHVTYNRDQWNIKVGIQNLLNENYYEHLSRKYKNMPDSYLLYEPGRNMVVNILYKF